jgi:delta(3,5)-delta(2,4)-dienoyl-CoA isomerase
MSVAATPALPAFSTLLLTHVADGVVEVKLNRGDKSNAMNRAMWQEIGDAFRFLATPDAPCRAILLTGAGKNFTSGLDLMDHIGLFTAGSGDESANDASRRALRLREVIRAYQASLSSIEACPKPVVAAIHGACIGGGVDMITAADVRFASTDAWFSIKEAEIGLAADVGTLQRLPKVRTAMHMAGIRCSRHVPCMLLVCRLLEMTQLSVNSPLLPVDLPLMRQ